MSSTQNLLELASQLQNLDSSLTTFLLEMVIKLASLTESSVFVLIENPEGRKFAGKSHLCKAYNEGKLVNTGNDLELEADVNYCSLRIKPTLMASTLVPSPRKRRHALSVSNSLVKKIKTETPPEDSLSCTVEAIVLNDDDDDDAAAATAASAATLTRDRAPDWNLTSYDAEEADSTKLDFSFDAFEISGGGVSGVGGVPAYDASWVSNEFVKENPKASTIVDAGGDTDFGGNSAMKRILDSLLYDLGKCGAHKYYNLGEIHTPQRSKEYLSTFFQEWLNQFPRLLELEKIELDFTAEKRFPFKVYMRARISNTFSSYVRRLMKK